MEIENTESDQEYTLIVSFVQPEDGLTQEDQDGNSNNDGTSPDHNNSSLKAKRIATQKRIRALWQRTTQILKRSSEFTTRAMVDEGGEVLDTLSGCNIADIAWMDNKAWSDDSLQVEQLRRVSEKRVSAVVGKCERWDEWMVADWIKDLGFPQYQDCFVSNFVDGRRLKDMRYCTLPSIGIQNFEHIQVICKEIYALLGVQPEPHQFI